MQPSSDIIYITFNEEKIGYNGTVYPILKSSLSTITPFLEFSDKDKNPLKFYLDSQSETTWFYIIRFDAKIGINKIYIHPSNINNSSIDVFDDYYDLSKGLDGRLQVSDPSTGGNEAAYLALVWRNSLTGSTIANRVIQEVDGLRYVGNFSHFIRPISSVKNKDSFGDTWEAKVEHNNIYSRCIFGFSMPSLNTNSYSEGIKKGNNNSLSTGNNIYYNESNSSSFKTDTDAEHVKTDIFGFNTFENGGNSYFISEDYSSKIESGFKQRNPNSGLQTNIRHELKIWSYGVNLSDNYKLSTKWFWIRKRTNPIPNTFIITINDD
jgi:hypothetical protein